MAMQLYKYDIALLGPGTLLEEEAAAVVVVEGSAKRKKKSPAAPAQSLLVLSFIEQIKRVPGLTATVWDFSGETTDLGDGTHLLHEDVRKPSPAAIAEGFVVQGRRDGNRTEVMSAEELLAMAGR